MALTVTSEAKREADRILGCSDVFSVLELNPALCKISDVERSFREKRALLFTSEGLRNVEVRKARSRLESAHAALRDPSLFNKARQDALASVKASRETRQRFDALAARTVELEDRVRQIKNARRIVMSEQLPTN